MPKKVPDDKDSAEQPKIVIDDAGEPNAKSSGVSFLAGLLLVLLVLAAIGSFSIIAMELGEIKRLVGLKESTGEEIKENEKKISNLKGEISKLISEKLSAEQESAKAKDNSDRYKRSAEAWKDSFARYRNGVSEGNATYQALYVNNGRLKSENETLSKNLSNIKTQKSLLESQIKDLKLVKEELNKYPALIASKKRERDNIEAQKELAEEAKEQAELTKSTLTVQISTLEERKNAVLAETLKGEELAKIISREQAKLDEIKASILSAEKAKEDKTKLETQIAILEKKKNDFSVEKIKNEELAKSALSELTALKGESSAKLEQKIESEARHSYLIKENSRLQSERDSLSAEILKLNQDYGKKISEYQDAFRKWEAAVKAKKNESQGQSNQ